MYDFNPHTMLILLVSSSITVGIAWLATRGIKIKINFAAAFLLSLIFGIVSGLLGRMSYGLLMIWVGNWVSPLVLGLAAPRYCLVLGVLTNTVALITELVWGSRASVGSFDLNTVRETFGKDIEWNLFFWLIGVGTSLLVTVPIFYHNYKRPSQKAAIAEEASDEQNEVTR